MQLLFDGGHYNIQGLAGGGYYLRAASDRGNTVLYFKPYLDLPYTSYTMQGTPIMKLSIVMHDFLFSFTIETPDSTTSIHPTTDDSTDYTTDDSTDDTNDDSPECFRAVCRTGN